MCSQVGAITDDFVQLNTHHYWGGLAVTGYPVRTFGYTVLEIANGGFNVYYKIGSYFQILANSGLMYYVAIG